jgi:hypothetical protein
MSRICTDDEILFRLHIAKVKSHTPLMLLVFMYVHMSQSRCRINLPRGVTTHLAQGSIAKSSFQEAMDA